MKKFLLPFLLLLLVLVPCKKTFASTNIPEDSLLKKVSDLNDENWNKFLSQSNTNKIQTKESYFKVLENSKTKKINFIPVTKESYEFNSRICKFYVTDTPENWLKVKYEVMPMYNNRNKFSVIAGFTWATRPWFQNTDMFVIGSDSNSVMPGSGSLVNFTYWPNTSRRDIFSTLNSNSYRSNFIFKQGAVGVKFKIMPDSLHYATKKYPGSFSCGRNGDYITHGTPEGVLGFTASFSGGNDITSIGLNYFHSQINFSSPGLSVGAKGGVDLTGIASSGYDKAQTSFNYHKGQTLN